MADGTVIQVLEKRNYVNQKLIALPSEAGDRPLAPSSVRVKTKVMCISVNNLTYARLAFIGGWWDIHPLPPSTPAPYDDSEKFGCTNTWGFQEVLESTIPSVPKGSFLWGYLRLGNLPQDLEVKDTGADNQIMVTNRSHVWPFYNRYIIYPPSFAKEIDQKARGPAYDSIMRLLFETGYLLAEFGFASNPEKSAGPSVKSPIEWTPEVADLTNATVFILAPGSKTGLAFAHVLRNRQAGAKPKQVVAATSEATSAFVKSTGAYDAVVLTSESPVDFLTKLNVGSSEKVVMVDFGGRNGIVEKWGNPIREVNKNFMVVGIGRDTTTIGYDQIMKDVQTVTPLTDVIIRANAAVLREKAIEMAGEKEYFAKLDTEWESWKGQGIPGFKINWQEGMDAVKDGWDKLCEGKVTPDEGLVYTI